MELARHKKQSADQGGQTVTRREPEYLAPPRWRALCRSVGAASACLAALGCDIVQGFENAGDTLFPEQATHLASPGLHLVSGNYRNVSVASGRELYLLARPADGGDSLFAMRYVNPEPCEIPHVGRFAASRDPKRPQALLSYLHEDAQWGTLHFADTSCKQFDFTLDNATFPVGETEESLIVLSNSALWAVDPEAGTQASLVPAVSEVLGNMLGGKILVRGGGRLHVFGKDWKPQGVFGDAVGSLQRAGNDVLYLDSTGLRKLSSIDATSVKDAAVASDVCSLGMQDNTWATYYSPCTERTLVAYHTPTGRSFTLDSSADPRFLRLLPARGSAGQDPTKDAFWYLFLRDFDDSTARGTFVVRNPRGEEHVIGSKGTLVRSELVESEGESHGYALVNMDGEVGDYVWWNAEGESKVLAKKVYWRPYRLITDFDGQFGNVAAVSGDRITTVAERVPWQSFEFVDANRQSTVLFHDWQGYSGTLSVFPGTFEDLAGTPLNVPLQRPPLQIMATNVAVFSTAPLGAVLPGAIYLSDYDLATQTGRLTYRNTELRFSAVVDSGVSDYIVGTDEVLYSVPYGPQAGIWLVPGK